MSTIEQRAAIAAAQARRAVPPGLSYVDRSVAALTAAQAQGVDPVLAANPQRRGLVITPPADGALALAPGAPGAWKLFAGLDRQWTGPATPTGALYVTGLAAGAALIIQEG